MNTQQDLMGCTSILYMPIFPSNEDADITPGILGYQCTSKFQLVLAGNSHTICIGREENQSSSLINAYAPSY